MAKTPYQPAEFRPALRIAPLVAGRPYRIIRAAVWLGVLLSSGCAVGAAAGAVVDGVWSVAPLGLAASQWAGGALLGISVLLVLYSFRFFYNHFYFAGLDTLIEGARASTGTVFEVAVILYKHEADVLAGLVASDFGQTWCRRLGVTSEEMAQFLAQPRTALRADAITAAATGQLTLPALTRLVIKLDTSFVSWLQSQGVTVATMNGALEWTYREHLAKKRAARWWSRDNLSQVQGIGRSFAYGFTKTLDRFTKPLGTGVVYAQHTADESLVATYVEQIESALVRDRNANVLLVGPAGVGKLDLLVTVAKRMQSGASLGAVEGTELILLDTEILTAATNDKAAFETTLLKVLSEAAQAGNVVLVIDKIDTVLENARELGVDVVSLLDSYLASPQLHIIATADQQAYHRSLETKAAFTGRFATVYVTPPDKTAILRLITTLASDIEQRSARRFTFAALEQIVESADRHIVSGVMPGKAVQLLTDVAASAPAALVTQADVQALVAETTGIPVGPIGAEERDVLLQLEDVLHQQVVGQDRAIDAISGVMRRSRTDIHDAEKPIGSFLFLGPTGVGKTESAKALARVFFHDEAAMHRLDMSEYSGADALERLIGSSQQAGALTNVLAEQPYAVILLDEFEKASRTVHDLFLQILDEGFYTDAHSGQKVNVRNCIIIATSNAGSAQISEWVAAGESLDDKKDAIVDHLISEQLYRPELINRFDDVVLFSPLTQGEQREIARLMLNELCQRITEKGYQLQVTDELVDTLVAIGYQPEFGARPMRRAIQEVVEEAIAEQIIAGTLQKGDSISLTKEELEWFRGTA